MQPWSQPLLWKATSTAVACDPYFGNVVLLMGYEGTNGATTGPGVTDESPAAHGAATLLGAGVSINTGTFKFGTSSLATGNARTQYADSNDWNLGGGQFTVEFWANFLNPISTTEFLIGQWQSAGNLGWEIWANNSQLAWSTSTTGSDNNADITASTTLSINTWYHVCVDFDGSKYRLYQNGVMVGSFATPRTIFNSSLHLTIGSNDVGGFFFSGFMDELRITKGVARYASDAGFAVPTAAFPRIACPACDPYFGNVVLLAGFNGTNGSTGAPGMTDESPAAHGTATARGTAQISTTQAKFGASSLTVNATSSVTWPSSTDFTFGSGAFTVELFIWPTSTTGGPLEVIGVWGGASNGWVIYTINGQWYWNISTTGADNIVVEQGCIGAMTLSAWNHLAIDFDGTTYRLYVNGTTCSTSTTLRTMFSGTSVLSIGSDATNANNIPTAYIDEVRITKGVARYANNTSFAVPTAAFPRVQC